MWENERDSRDVFKVSGRIFLMGQTRMNSCTMPSTLYVTVNCITMETTTKRKADERAAGRGERQKHRHTARKCVRERDRERESRQEAERHRRVHAHRGERHRNTSSVVVIYELCHPDSHTEKQGF